MAYGHAVLKLKTIDPFKYEGTRCTLSEFKAGVGQHGGYARNTPGSSCQYKEDDLVSRPLTLFTAALVDLRVVRHAQSLNSSHYVCDRKIWKWEK